MTETPSINTDGTMATEMPEVSETLTKEEMKKMAREKESFSMVRVSSSEHDEFGIKWAYLIRRKDGGLYDFSWWHHVKRDNLAQWLMARGELSDLPPFVIKEGGSGDIPLYYLDKA